MTMPLVNSVDWMRSTELAPPVDRIGLGHCHLAKNCNGGSCRNRCDNGNSSRIGQSGQSTNSSKT